MPSNTKRILFFFGMGLLVISIFFTSIKITIENTQSFSLIDVILHSNHNITALLLILTFVIMLILGSLGYIKEKRVLIYICGTLGIIYCILFLVFGINYVFSNSESIIVEYQLKPGIGLVLVFIGSLILLRSAD